MSMVEDGVLDPKLAPSLRIHLDWIQYKTNFRDPVMVRRTADGFGHLLPLAEIAVDLRQADAGRLPGELADAVRTLSAAPDANPEQPRLPGRLPPLSGVPDLGVQPPVLAPSGRLGGGVRQGLRGRAAGGLVGRQPPRGGGRLGEEDLGADPRDPAQGPAAGGDRRPGDRRRHRRARGVVAGRVQGDRRRGRHRLLRPDALHPRRLLADQPRARDGGREGPRGSRRRRAAGRPEPVQGARRLPVQGDVRPLDQHLRQPAVRRPGAARRQAVSGRGAAVL